MIMTMPPPPRAVVAQLIYVGNATQPSWVFIPQRSKNGESLTPLKLSGEQWRLMQLLQRSGSRFV